MQQVVAEMNGQTVESLPIKQNVSESIARAMGPLIDFDKYKISFFNKRSIVSACFDIFF